VSDAVVHVVRRPDYWIGLEQHTGHAYVHSTVHRWTHAVARRFRADLDALLALHGGPLLATTHLPHAGDFDKFRKFVTSMGFSFSVTVPVAGAWHSVYIRKQ
jgi:hypothetical protein